MAGTTAWLTWRHRQPIVTAWSTPGAALIAATPGIYDPHQAVGAFLFAAALILLSAALKPLAALIERIPPAIAGAMLAGVLLRFVVGAVAGIDSDPLFVLVLIGLFLVLRLAAPIAAVPIIVVVGLVWAWLGGKLSAVAGVGLSHIELIAPSFEPAALIGLGVPLFLVTMASQNLPGFAVLRAAGYAPPVRPILAVTGLASLLTAPLGAHTSNLAAITASLCTGPDTHPDPAKRWQVGPFYTAGYLLCAVLGASLVAVFAALPPALMATIAGLALLAPFVGALGVALERPAHRYAAGVTFAVSAAGVTFLGLGSAFWGLVAGILVLALDHMRAIIVARRPPHP
jgi:benzoate membrane transport protein